MAMIGSKGPKIKSSGLPLRFAKPLAQPDIPKSKGFLDGLIGVLRIVGLVAEVVAAIIMPAYAPFIAIAGGAFQQAIDIYQLAQQPSSDWRTMLSFGMNTAINFVPIAFGARKIIKKSKDVIKIATKGGGFKYVVRGQSPSFNKYFKRIDKGLKLRSDRVSRVNIATQNNLLAKGQLSKQMGERATSIFDLVIKKHFKGTGPSGWNQFWKGGYGTKVRYSMRKAKTFSNRDISIITKTIKQVATDKINVHQALQVWVKKLSKSAKSAFDIGKIDKFYHVRQLGHIISEKAISKIPTSNKLIWRTAHMYDEAALNVLDWAQLWLRSFAPNKVKPLRKIGLFQKMFRFFGKKKGHLITQLGQLPNPNDFAREVLRQPQSWILDGGVYYWGGKDRYLLGKWWGKTIGGIRGGARKLREKLKQHSAIVKKILESPLTRRLYAHYELVRKALKQNGTLTKNPEFLMGWRTLSTNKLFSQVIFYFNPINTRSKTPGTFNYGGKPAIPITLDNAHLAYLRRTMHPGRAYLKGGGGFPAIANTPGGRRARMSWFGKVFELLSIKMPLTPLRNILSLMSNTRDVILKNAKGTFVPTWTTVFRNTVERLYVNRLTRVVGQGIGNLVSNEMGMHMSRILKGVAQGFQKTKTETIFKDGVKIKSTRTVLDFSKSYNTSTLIKTATLHTARSVGLRRITRGTSVKERQKIKRYGVNIRRIPGLFIVR